MGSPVENRSGQAASVGVKRSHWVTGNGQRTFRNTAVCIDSGSGVADALGVACIMNVMNVRHTHDDARGPRSAQVPASHISVAPKWPSQAALFKGRVVDAK